jgi:hypothetical protein
MKKSWLLSLAGLVATAPAFAASNYRYVHLPQDHIYFGHVSYCEAKGELAFVLRGDAKEEATLNFPLAPGDSFVTPPGRRCEAQFDTGTILRLDGDTTLAIETILARALSSSERLTNLHLAQGRVQLMYRDYDSSELFQVLTANAAVKLSRAAVVDVALGPAGETRVSVERGSASLLFGPRADRTKTRKLKAGESATVSADHEVVVAARIATADGDAFAAWNREMNEHFVERHEGKSPLPKPIYNYPRAVVDFAQRFADPYGEWIWSDLYGYVWRPYLSRDEGWRPYMQGRWVPVSGQLFWVPQEPWGWVPYHLGLWHWDKKHGWVWLPGSAFAPAWVSWSTCAGGDARYYRPLSLWDWSRTHPGARYAGYRYAGYGYGYGYDPTWGIDPCGYYGRYDNRVAVDLSPSEQPQSSRPAAPNPADDGQTTPPRQRPEKPLLPLQPQLQLPSDLEKVANRVAKAAVEQGEVRAAVQLTQGSGSLVPSVELARPEGSLALESIQTLGPRFRDWNSDVRAARSVGGHIVYSSVTNKVSCEDCSRPLTRLVPEFGPWRDGMAPYAGQNSSTSSSDGGGGAAAPTTTSSGPNNAAGGRDKNRD